MVKEDVKKIIKKAVKERNKDSAKIGEIKNEPSPGHKMEYIAVCNFTTLGFLKNGITGNKKVKKGETITAKDTPLQWINMAVAARHLISKEDKDKLSNKELKARGYSL